MSFAAVERAIAPASGDIRTWDSEVFLLCGDDRSHLSARVQELNGWLSGHPQTVLQDLAYSLNRIEPHGHRLALVAGTVADLQRRLDRAAQRLADPDCRQIKDVSGIYYFEQPLAPQGRLAMLFPGEGAQYLNMVGDLRQHFPEVRDCFASCDALVSRRQGRPLSEIIFVPGDASPEFRAGAEKELGELGNAIFSVLLADWALQQLLAKLGLRPDAVAGHSAGELAALWVAGCFQGEDYGLDHIAATMQNLQRQEDQTAVESVLLAVGASRKAMTELLEQLMGGGLGGDLAPESLVAMDNCPHQTVLVGPPAVMAKLEDLLRARRMVYERLSLQRPYHTQLFEPFMGTIREMFADTAFRVPATTIYSCTTARPFPADPDAVRELMLSHWSSRVEFTQMIENMYADGVRLFVESGPKGNLCAFVEDILRGRPFLAVPADVQRRSGLTQLNHLVGQLAAHHVPLALDHLYCRRSPQVIDWETPPRTAQLSGGQTMRSDPPHTGKAAVLSEYLRVMEQFLDTQREVMEHFLQRRAAAVGQVADPSISAGWQPAPQIPPGILVGEILQHTPGRELIMRRRLDLHEDLYAGDHTVGGRSISKVDPTQHGLPIMPMTFTLEMMAQVASLLVPGKVVTELKDIRLFRWLEFDEHDPISVELTARVSSRHTPCAVTGDSTRSVPATNALAEGEETIVSVEIRHLGNRKSPPGADRWSCASGNVVLAGRWPEVPPPGAFPLSNERRCRITLAELHRNLFHGPLFHGVLSMGRIGDEGLESQVRVLPHSGLFRSTTEPGLLTDPVLLDVVMHPLAAWHLEQPDQSGRILLPCELESVRFYGPRPETGTQMTSRVRTLHETRRQITHAVDAIRADGTLWCRMSAVKYWRFYLPFGDINFHGPKDEYFLSKDLDGGRSQGSGAGGQGRGTADVTTTRNASLRLPTPDFRLPIFHCVSLDPPTDLLQPAMLLVTAQITLSPAELAHFGQLKLPDRKRAEWLFGRIAAKDAVRLLWWTRERERLFPADIEIEPDAHGRPVAVFRDRGRLLEFPNVSISHSAGVSMALAAHVPCVGIDIEKVVPREKGFDEVAFDENERRLLDQFRPRRDEALTRLWCAKEAVAKALGRGLVDGPRSLAVRRIDANCGTAGVALGRRLAAEFPQFDNCLLQVHTFLDDDFVVATTLCERLP